MRALIVVVLFTLTFISTAQEVVLDRAALPMGSAAIRARIQKEQVPMTVAWADTLRYRSERARPSEAVRFLEYAVVILDTLQERTREREAFFALSKAQESAGRTKDALISLRAAHFLKDSLAATAVADSLARTEDRLLSMQVEWQRTLAQQAQDNKAEAQQYQTTQRTLERLLAAAGILIALLVAALAWVSFRASRQRHRNVQGLGPATTVAEGVPKRNVLRPVPVVKEEVSAPPAPSHEVDPEAAMLLALFHKHMPERLRTLQDARSRGDHEKVVRVLASMRPQLASHDASLFAARCAGLIAARESVLEPAHALDLDRLIADVEQALRGTGARS